MSEGRRQHLWLRHSTTDNVLPSNGAEMDFWRLGWWLQQECQDQLWLKHIWSCVMDTRRRRRSPTRMNFHASTKKYIVNNQPLFYFSNWGYYYYLVQLLIHAIWQLQSESLCHTFLLLLSPYSSLFNQIRPIFILFSPFIFLVGSATTEAPQRPGGGQTRSETQVWTVCVPAEPGQDWHWRTEWWNQPWAVSHMR